MRLSKFRNTNIARKPITAVVRVRLSAPVLVITAVLLAVGAALSGGIALAAPQQAGSANSYRVASAPLAAPPCAPAWNTVPNPTPSNGKLSGVAAVSSDDVWAVGYTTDSGTDHPLIEHWDGSSWSIVNGAAGVSGYLSGVAAVSSNDVWAVGYDSGTKHPLIEHWNGSVWSVVSSAIVGSSSSLSDIAALNSNDILAVGNFVGSHSYSRTWAERWNGSSWQSNSLPLAGELAATLYGVAAVSSDDIWAVGAAYDDSGEITTADYRYHNHQWNGGSGANSGEYFDVAALNSNDVWFVGYDSDNETTLIRHTGDGPRQSYDGLPAGALNGVVAINSNDVWAVGSTIVHWDGSAWSVVVSPAPAELADVAAVSSTDIWAVGRKTIVHYSPPCSVSWIDAVNVAKSGNSLTKTAGGGGWNAGAASSQAIPVGQDGSAQISVVDTSTDYVLFGLSNGDSNATFTDIDFAIETYPPTNELWIREQGQVRATIGGYAVGDVLKVEVQGNVVRYYRNASLLYTSTAVPVRPLLMDTSLYNQGARLADAYILATSYAPVPSWTPTQTRTATPTRTATQTRTVTVTRTPTRTRTATVTRTRTATPTRTATATRTVTITRTPTRTRTATVTRTRTATPTRTATVTRTRTATRTSTPAH